MREQLHEMAAFFREHALKGTLQADRHFTLETPAGMSYCATGLLRTFGQVSMTKAAILFLRPSCPVEGCGHTGYDLWDLMIHLNNTPAASQKDDWPSHGLDWLGIAKALDTLADKETLA